MNLQSEAGTEEKCAFACAFVCERGTCVPAAWLRVWI